MPLPVARSRHCAGIQKRRAGRQVTRQTQAHLNSCRQLDQVSVAIFPRTFAENAHTNEDTGQARVCSTGLRDCTTQHAALTVITNTGERASATEDNRGGGGVGGLLGAGLCRYCVAMVRGTLELDSHNLQDVRIKADSELVSVGPDTAPRRLVGLIMSQTLCQMSSRVCADVRL